MRVDRYTSLRQRLRREADAFDFNALLEGVSTIEEEPVRPEALPPSEPPEVRLTLPDTTVLPHQTTLARAAHTTVEFPAEAVAENRPTSKSEPLRIAINGLCERLLDEAGQFRAACERSDAWSAGHRLAQINRLLDMLHNVDADGSLARSLQVPAAPPENRTWPRATWTAVELAESPLSGLVPASAPPSFLREMFRAAWGFQPRASA